MYKQDEERDMHKRQCRTPAHSFYTLLGCCAVLAPETMHSQIEVTLARSYNIHILIVMRDCDSAVGDEKQ